MSDRVEIPGSDVACESLDVRDDLNVGGTLTVGGSPVGGLELENAGAPLAGGPFGTLNITTGAVATDAGGGVADVAVTGGGESPSNYVITDYTATGAEGDDFMVNLSTAMLSDAYALMVAVVDAVAVPVITLPNAIAGDRTTTQFRVTTAVQMQAGTVLQFVAFAR